MQNPTMGEESREARALVRFAAVQSVLQGVQGGQSLVQALKSASEQSWEGRLYSFSTIEDWYYRYRDRKFAGLVSPRRSDRGESRAMDPASVEELYKLRREHPEMTVPALLAELVRRGVLEEDQYSASTVHRRLAEEGLDRKSLKAGSGQTSGPTKAFEVALPNILWMADCMYGPTLSGEKSQRTFLFCLIDDCSRLLVHGQFYPQERLEGFLDTLKQAVQNRGVPEKLYTDHGAAFMSQHLGIVCANLGIRLLHAKPYHAWSKGKIERLFFTVQSQFLPTLSFEPVKTIDELNRRFWKWAETDYNHREHSALSGESPAQRFARLGEGLRVIDGDVDLDGLFLMRIQRRVRKDATFSLGGILWDVPAHLRGQMVTVHFDPIGLGRVDVWLNERPIGQARRCDKVRNAQFAKSSDYDPSF